MSKFNQELITKARKGEIAILNDGTKDELQSVLMEVWNDLDGFSGKSKFFSRYCPRAKTWAAYDQTHLPAHSVKEFYMIDTKDNDQPRTYKVTRGQMHELYSEAMATGGHVKIMEITSLRFGVWENETNLFNDDLEEISSILPQSPLLKSIFPDYFYIPEGEPVLVLDSNKARSWLIRISDGKGGVYIDGRLSGESVTGWSEIIPFTKNPPK